MITNRLKPIFMVVSLLLLVAGPGLAGKDKKAPPKAKASAAKHEVVPAAPTGPAAQASPATPATDWEINWWVISAGGVDGSSASYQMKATVGQTAVGGGSSASYRLSSGFWPDFGSPGCCELRGDLDHNGTVDIADILYFVEFSFGSPPGPAPVCNDGTPEEPYYPEADLNADMNVDIADLLYFVEYSFGSPPGPPPEPC